MKDTICNQVRLEIDEAEMTAPLSAAAKEHLKSCGECKDSYVKEMKLRQIVGSLEPVNAPPDFDFRLRARLANERSLSNHFLASPLRLFRSRSLAVAAMLLIFAATVVMIRQTNRKGQLPDTTTASTRDEGSPITDKPVTPVITQPTDEGTQATIAVNDRNKPNRRTVNAPTINKRPAASIEFSGTSAPVIRNEQSMATMAGFPLDVSKQSFKVSLDDAHGSSKTILVPAVSFGAGRALTGTAPVNQFAPKGDW